MSKYKKAYFLLSVADVKQLPPDEGFEVAIVGRSNAGKSSIINKITQSKNLARVSKTPGRTQMVNIFVLDEDRRLADLPGFGYAKAPVELKKKWEKTVDAYISDRKCLKGLMLVMDIRHPLKELDWQMLEFCQHNQLPVHILLNKMDKISKTEFAKTLARVRSALTPYENIVTLQGFSATKGIGLPDLYKVLDFWFDYN
jgi:GTP-binding protein